MISNPGERIQTRNEVGFGVLLQYQYAKEILDGVDHSFDGDDDDAQIYDDADDGSSYGGHCRNQASLRNVLVKNPVPGG